MKDKPARSVAYPRNPLTLVAIPVALSASFLVGCSGASAHATETLAGQPGVSSTHTRAAVVGENNVIAVGVAPEADCRLHLEGEDPSAGVDLVADDEGLVQFTLRPTTLDTKPVVLLDCQEGDGAILQHSVAITTVRTAAERVSVRETPLKLAASAVRFTRPALEGEPGAPSNAELVARGFPPRPDATRSPESYAEWLAIVAKPVTHVRSSGRHHVFPARTRQNVGRGGTVTAANEPARRPPSAQNGSEFSANWSGVVTEDGIGSNFLGDYNAGSPYDYVTGQWTVPALASHESSRPTYSAAWVGLGGIWTVTGGIEGRLRAPIVISNSLVTGDASNTPLIQTGTNQDYVFVGSTGIAVANAWYEYAVSNPSVPSTMEYFPISIKAGDSVKAWAWAGDQYSTISGTGAYGWFYIADNTSGVTYAASLAQPSNVIGYFGESAEWIVERPLQGGELPDLADYNAVLFSSNVFEQANGTSGTAQAGIPISMYSLNTGSVISQCEIAFGSLPYCWWLGFN